MISNKFYFFFSDSINWCFICQKKKVIDNIHSSLHSFKKSLFDIRLTMLKVIYSHFQFMNIEWITWSINHIRAQSVLNCTDVYFLVCVCRADYKYIFYHLFLCGLMKCLINLKVYIKVKYYKCFRFQTFSNLSVSRDNKILADADLVRIWLSLFKKEKCNIFYYIKILHVVNVTCKKSENCEHFDKQCDQISFVLYLDLHKL